MGNLTVESPMNDWTKRLIAIALLSVPAAAYAASAAAVGGCPLGFLMGCGG